MEDPGAITLSSRSCQVVLLCWDRFRTLVCGLGLRRPFLRSCGLSLRKGAPLSVLLRKSWGPSK